MKKPRAAADSPPEILPVKVLKWQKPRGCLEHHVVQAVAHISSPSSATLQKGPRDFRFKVHLDCDGGAVSVLPHLALGFNVPEPVLQVIAAIGHMGGAESSSWDMKGHI